MELFKSRARIAYTNAVGDKVYPVIVDIKKGIKSTEEIQFMSSDINTGVLSVAFINGSVDFNLGGSTVLCSVMRPDTTTLEIPCTIVEGNIVEVPLGVNGTSQEGVYSFDFKIVKGDEKIIGTPTMYYSVALSIDSDMAVEDDDRLPVLIMLMNQTTSLKLETEQVISQANDAIELSRVATENATQATTVANATINQINQDTANAIDRLDTAVGNVDSKITEVETRFNTLTSSQQQSSEVIDARDGEVSLKARLDRDIEKAKQIYVDVEGSIISTQSSDGYLKDVEIKGNTIQDAENLADIRSVGDKVEGQELYKIDVVSCGKNLFNTKKAVSTTGVSGISVVATNSDMILTATSGAYNMLPINYNLKPNTKYILKGNHTVLNGKGRPYCEVRDINGVLLGSNGWKLPVQFTTDNTGFVKILFGCNDNENNASISYYNIQLEEGTVATPYEPYQEDKLTILSPVQLEKVGDVRDRIICKDGVWGVEKHLLDVTFTGNEEWLGETESIKDVIRFRLKNNPYDFSNINKELVICDKFTFLTSAVSSNYEVEGISVSKHNNYGILVSIRKDKLTSNNSDGFNAWLKNNGGLKVIASNNISQFIPLPYSQQIKLRTFANKTNISFLTEIEGTIKAQVPKSIGASINTHTEQIESLNKELDRVKKLEESTVSTVETESNFTTVTETSNGYFEDVKLEGKTLVNLVKTFSNDMSDWLQLGDLVYEVTDKTITVCNLSNKNIKFQTSKLDNSFDNQIIINPFSSVVVTLNNVKFRMIQGAYSDGWTSSDLDVFKKAIVILEGDHTQSPPSYFEGLLSVGQDVEEVSVKSVNENLLNLEDLGVSNIVQFVTIEHMDAHSIKLNTLGTNTDQYTSVGFDTFKFIPNVKYKVKAKCTHSDSTNAPFISIRKYNNNNSSLMDAKMTNGVIEATFVPTHTKHRIDFFTGNHVGSTGGTWVEFADIQISIDNDDFSYFTQNQSDKKRLLYYNNETQTWEKPILREWDTIEKHSDGKYYYHKRSGEVVLNGSENIVLDKTHTNNLCFRFVNTLNKCKSNCDLLSDKFTHSLNVYDNDIEGLYYTGVLRVNILKSRLSTQDVECFKQWLQANPTTVVYQLAQEEVYECTNIDLITYADETNYVVNSGAISPKSILKVHSNISNVVKILQEKVSLLEDKFIEGLKQVLAGDMYSLATLLYPEDFETENSIMLLPLE